MTTPEQQVAPATDRGNRTADEGVRAGSGRVEPVVRARTPNSPSAVAGPVGAALCGCSEDEIARAIELLRSMEQRALWGPDHQVVQP